jgi:hypothetical protein
MLCSLLAKKFKQELQVLWGELKNFPREKDPEILKPYFKKMGQYNIYLFRHGETVYNKKKVFTGWKDSSLTNKGVSQAKYLAKILKNKQIDVAIQTPLKRSKNTLKLGYMILSEVQENESVLHNEQLIFMKNNRTSKIEMSDIADFYFIFVRLGVI